MDLIADPWLEVFDKSRRTAVSLAEALVSAHELDGMAEPVPTVRVAVLRQVLLAVVFDALGLPRTPEEWGARWAAGRFDEEVLRAYLDEHHSRFHLFDDHAPFAQTAGLVSVKGDLKPASLLVPNIASGNNVPLFTARSEAEPVVLSPTDALRWLLYIQCWDTAAIKTGAEGDPKVSGGKTYGNPTGPLGRLGVVVPTGRTLFETLMLNTPVVPDGLDPADAPQWRRPPPTAVWSERAPSGILDLFTWPARRVRLIPEDVEGRTVVRSVVIAAGDRILGEPGPDLEIHTLWGRDRARKGETGALRPRRHRSGRAAWQGFDALRALDSSTSDAGCTARVLSEVGARQVEEQLPDTYPLGLELTGVEYGSQFAIVEDVLSDVIPLPVLALRADSAVGAAIDDLAGIGGGLVKAIDVLEGDLCRALGGELVPWDSGQRASTRLVHRLDHIARRVLALLQERPDDVDAIELAWRDAAEAATNEGADELLTNRPPSAHAGRLSGSTDSHAVTWNVATAELGFRSRLRKVLPRYVEEEAVAI